MSTIERTVEVNVPIRTVYDQWTQFEEFPQFMEGVESVTQLDDTHVRWVAEIGGQRREWEAEITEQLPDKKVAWRAVDGTTNAGAVTFHRLGTDFTQIILKLDFEPEGPAEKAGDRLGVVAKQAEDDLHRFKELIESRGFQSGGWRGEVHGGAVRR